MTDHFSDKVSMRISRNNKWMSPLHASQLQEVVPLPLLCSAELALHLPSVVKGFAYTYVFLNSNIALLTYVNTNYQVDILTNESKSLKNGSSKSSLFSDM